MSIVKSYSFPEGEIRGDMFYIQHNSGNFTVIDCYLKDGTDKNCREDEIINEILNASRGKAIHRFISTHPDKDHILGIEKLDEFWGIPNFYAVQNHIPADKSDDSLSAYIRLKKDHLHPIKSNMIVGNERFGYCGLSFHWPILTNEKFQSALKQVAVNRGSPNDISCILTYQPELGPTYMWMGDLETDMQQEYYNCCKGHIPEVDILFHPHHGRKSGKVPNELLNALDPKLIIIGNAPSEYIDYGDPAKTITQNTAGNIVFVNNEFSVDIYTQNRISNPPKCLKRLNDRKLYFDHCFYCGTLGIDRYLDF